MKIKTVNEGGLIKVTSPYNSSFVQKARNLQGTFSLGQWIFPKEIEEHVINAVRECFGVDGTTDYETCVLIVKNYSLSVFTSGIELFGRPIAKAFGRDSGAKLSDGIILLNGTITSGGSVKNWKTVIDNATFEIHNFPVDALEMFSVKEAIQSGWVEIKRHGKTREAILSEIEAYKQKIAELESRLI